MTESGYLSLARRFFPAAGERKFFAERKKNSPGLPTAAAHCVSSERYACVFSGRWCGVEIAYDAVLRNLGTIGEAINPFFLSRLRPALAGVGDIWSAVATC